MTVRPALIALAAACALILGCSPPAAVEDPGPVSAVLPADAEHPKELLGTWKLANGTALDLREKGEAVNTLVVGGQTQGAEVSPQIQPAKWGVKGKELFLTINGFTTVYDFKVSGSTLTMGKGRIKFDYKR